MLKEQGVALTSTSSPGGFADLDTAIVTRVVHQTVDKAIKVRQTLCGCASSPQLRWCPPGLPSHSRMRVLSRLAVSQTMHADFMEEMAAEINELDRLKDLENSVGQMSERLGSLEALMQKLVDK